MTTTAKILVTGGTGKTGRRVAQRLREVGVPVRVASRSAAVPFDWADRSTWTSALRGVEAAYLAYAPDLAAPGAPETIDAFTRQAARAGVRRLVLLSGRGEEEARACERIVQDAGPAWTVLRASWFCQNFSEDYLLDPVRGGVVVLPTGDVPEPFVDADDIADVAVAALTGDGHHGRVYELTGPRALTFGQAIGEIAAATGREIRFMQVPLQAYTGELARQGVPSEVVELLGYLFGTVLDGRNAVPADGVRQALGRDPRDFAAYARATAATGAWTATEAS
ncbi:NAD(P)H-binding protein [Microtetraspora niveoalba]|uniref:NAD(P)H-binding protein n=1 Tax=Microtetraspora niveoalba TaxID=46175 RepID=UPI00082F5742|nr:NAD(P)H-binding protein [Microtetraspora niveoalba]